MTFSLPPEKAYVARIVEAWLANNRDEAYYHGAVSACVEGILYGSGTPFGEERAELYEESARREDGEWLLYCETAGVYLRDWLIDEVRGEGLAWYLLQDLLNLGDQQLWAEIATSFMPDPERVWEEVCGSK